MVICHARVVGTVKHENYFANINFTIRSLYIQTAAFTNNTTQTPTCVFKKKLFFLIPLSHAMNFPSYHRKAHKNIEILFRFLSAFVTIFQTENKVFTQNRFI